MYARPRNVDQVVALLDALDTGAMLIAGGQELMPHINYGQLTPAVLVDISKIKELVGIERAEDYIAIGALTVHRDVIEDSHIREAVPLLAHAATQIGGGRQVHNRGTIGGNIVSMHPLYDIIPPLLALNAEVEIHSNDDSRRVPLAELLVNTGHGLGTTAILARVLVPVPAQRSGWGYEKLKITEGSYAAANAAAMIECDDDGRIANLHVVIGAVSEQALDVSTSLRGLVGESWSERAAEVVRNRTSDAVREPLHDQQGDGAYRRAMAGVVAQRALSAAYARATT